MSNLSDIEVVAQGGQVGDLRLSSAQSVVVFDGRLYEELLPPPEASSGRAPLVLLVDPDHALTMFQLLRAGVRGILLVDCPKAALLSAVRAAADGDLFVQREIVDLLARPTSVGFSATRFAERYCLEQFGLTARETQAWMLLVTGRSNEEIAEHMNLSLRTVRFHLSNLFRKVDVHTRSEAMALAYRTGVCGRAWLNGQGAEPVV